MSTLTFKNFRGDLTNVQHTTDVSGVVDARRAIFSTSFGIDNFHRPGVLSFQDALTNLTGTIVSDLIIDGESRVENGILYTYCIGHMGRLYKIQANIPGAQVAVYDNITLVTTLTTPIAFTQGGSLNFFGDDDRIYIGHDNGVTSVKIDGTDEKIVGNQWTAGMPRLGIIFKNKLFLTNGNNIGTILSNGTIESYTSILPAPEQDLIIKDIDIAPNGISLVIVGSNIPNTSIFSTTPELSGVYNGTATVINWTGNNTQVSSQIVFRSLDHTATFVIGDTTYIFGYDIAGMSVSTLINGVYEKVLGSLFTRSPMPNAIKANGNLIGWGAPEFSAGFMVQSLFIYGPLDRDFDATWNRAFKVSAVAAASDVLRVPWSRLISDFQLSGATTGYAGGVSGVARTYFSALEMNMAGVQTYKLYAYYNVPSGTAAVNGVYETQAALKDSGTYTPTATTVYFNPAVGSENFKVEYIGMDGNVIAGSAHTFTPSAGDISAASGALTVAATPCIGVRVTNNAVVSPIIHKIEVTY